MIKKIILGIFFILCFLFVGYSFAKEPIRVWGHTYYIPSQVKYYYIFNALIFSWNQTFTGQFILYTGPVNYSATIPTTSVPVNQIQCNSILRGFYIEMVSNDSFIPYIIDPATKLLNTSYYYNVLTGWFVYNCNGNPNWVSPTNVYIDTEFTWDTLGNTWVIVWWIKFYKNWNYWKWDISSGFLNTIQFSGDILYWFVRNNFNSDGKLVFIAPIKFDEEVINYFTSTVLNNIDSLWSDFTGKVYVNNNMLCIIDSNHCYPIIPHKFKIPDYPFIFIKWRFFWDRKFVADDIYNTYRSSFWWEKYPNFFKIVNKLRRKAFELCRGRWITNNDFNTYDYFNNKIICVRNSSLQKTRIYLDLNSIDHQTIITTNLDVILTGRLNTGWILDLFVDKWVLYFGSGMKLSWIDKNFNQVENETQGWFQGVYLRWNILVNWIVLWTWFDEYKFNHKVVLRWRLMSFNWIWTWKNDVNRLKLIEDKIWMYNFATDYSGYMDMKNIFDWKCINDTLFEKGIWSDWSICSKDVSYFDGKYNSLYVEFKRYYSRLLY